VYFIKKQKILIIAFMDENIFPVDAAVVDMVKGVMQKRGWTGHGRIRP
jgi:hypothetical protein